MATSALTSLFTQNSRACFFKLPEDPKLVQVEVSIVCYEVRGVDVAEGEKLWVSVRDVGKGRTERVGSLGSAMDLRVTEDSTLCIGLWAMTGESYLKRGQGPSRSRRQCGELRIPVARLLLDCHSMLYQTWLMLDADGPKLEHSVSSVTQGEDTCSSFEQAVQINMPMMCLSVYKTGELIPKRFLLPADAPDETRVDRWGALLRSQQQHAFLSRALNQQTLEEAEQKSSGPDQHLSDDRFREQVQAQAVEIEDLRRRLRNGPGHPGQSPYLPSNSPQLTPRMDGLEMDSRLDKAEIEELTAANENKRLELEQMRVAMQQLTEEANQKIDTANVKIRGLRQNRDEVANEARRITNETNQVALEVAQLESDIREQKEKKKDLDALFQNLTPGGLDLTSTGTSTVSTATSRRT